jgi:hypothetical protein
MKWHLVKHKNGFLTLLLEFEIHFITPNSSGSKFENRKWKLNSNGENVSRTHLPIYKCLCSSFEKEFVPTILL